MQTAYYVPQLQGPDLGRNKGRGIQPVPVQAIVKVVLYDPTTGRNLPPLNMGYPWPVSYGP